MDAFFDLCVKFLIWCAHCTGLSYKEINVWLFVIIHPAITLVLLVLYINMISKFRKLKNKLNYEKK
jgi:hypothetical protein